MHSRLYNHIRNILLPCLTFSVVTGVLAAFFVTAFKVAAEWVIHRSTLLYDWVRESPVRLPLLIAGTAAMGFIAALLLSRSHSCRGGGIPTSVAAIRGIVSFRWFAGLLVLPFSALLTFFSGLPLGTEGPCVQMGTAIGDGVIRLFGKNHRGWRRYIMTGGASAGFSIATASPVAAILFSMEELHKHFSPLLLTVASLSVVSAQGTTQALAALGIGTTELFSLPPLPTLTPRSLFIPLLIGLISGGSSIVFTRLYHLADKTVNAIFKKFSSKIVFPFLFATIAIVGFFLSDTLGTGHSLTNTLLHSRVVWYLSILILLIRAIGMTVSNTAGVTGGVFLPTLAFGALIGSLCAEGAIVLGLIGAEHYTLMVVLGITSFLGSTSRIPLTACVFAIEALRGIGNILPIIVATTVALLVVELSGLEDFTDTVINAKIHKISKGKAATVIEVPLTVAPHSFVIGMELHDILWPNACTVISFEGAEKSRESGGIAEGDVITVRYSTYNPAATAEEFTLLVGKQSENIRRQMILPKTH